MSTTVVIVAIGFFVCVGPAAYATYVVSIDDHYETWIHRAVILLICWLVPVVGPAICIFAYRSNNPVTKRDKKNDELNNPNDSYIFVPGNVVPKGPDLGDGGGD